MIQYLILFACGLLGMLFQNLRKFGSTNKKARLIDYKVSGKQFILENFVSILMQLAAIILGAALFKEVSGHYPNLINWQRTVFALLGGVGCEIISFFFDQAEANVIEKIKNFNPLADNKKP